MVNQLFCLTQSAGSASQPAQIGWVGEGAGGLLLLGHSKREEEEEEGEKN